MKDISHFNPCRRINMVGIISNTTAIGVQASLQKANLETSASAKKLSSGERIIQAKDDAAGLAIGTSLQGNVITLNAALTNTAQADALLGVVDGALKNIGEILQRQKALATQATSGTLGETTRKYLDLEFQNLKEEIDRIALTTNFNGIKLLDGSLYTPTEIRVKSEANTTAAQGVLEFADGIATIVDGESLEINGVIFTFDATPLAAPTSITNAAADGAERATQVYDAIQNVINSLDPAMAANKAALSGLNFKLEGANIVITSKASGAEFNDGGANVIEITGSATLDPGAITLNGAAVENTTLSLSDGGIAGVNGDLSAGTFALGGATAYAGTATTIAQGIMSDSILTALDTTSVTADTGINTSGISNNADFIGKISGFKATYSSPDRVTLSIKVGDYTYMAQNVETTPAANTIVRMASVEEGGGYFDLQFSDATVSGQTFVTNQAEADAFAARIDTALAGIDFFQNREISSYVGAGSVFPTGGSTQSGNLSGTKFNMINDNFHNVKIEAVNVQAPVVGGTEALIEITINGEVFRSGYDAIGSTTALGNGIAADATIGLVSMTDPRKILQFTNGSVDLFITNQAEAEGLKQALENAFGLGQGGSSLSFQVGTKAADTVKVQIEGASTTDIFRDELGTFHDISITTLENTNKAGEIVEFATNRILSLRANIGALQSRFSYAAANIQSSIQNQDAARGVFLDTDVASESTSFASAQVRLQASISVLAQANQIPQNLLKLIG